MGSCSAPSPFLVCAVLVVPDLASEQDGRKRGGLHHRRHVVGVLGDGKLQPGVRGGAAEARRYGYRAGHGLRAEIVAEPALHPVTDEGLDEHGQPALGHRVDRACGGMEGGEGAPRPRSRCAAAVCRRRSRAWRGPRARYPVKRSSSSKAAPARPPRFMEPMTTRSSRAPRSSRSSRMSAVARTPSTPGRESARQSRSSIRRGWPWRGGGPRRRARRGPGGRRR